MPRSPNQVMAAVRGIGVAVMTSKCGAVEPLAFNDSRCSTPKRCCSSMTASARLGAWKVLENAACVATTMHGLPEAACARTRRRAASFMPPVSSSTGMSGRLFDWPSSSFSTWPPSDCPPFCGSGAFPDVTCPLSSTTAWCVDFVCDSPDFVFSSASSPVPHIRSTMPRMLL